jgi:hypothetical protein
VLIVLWYSYNDNRMSKGGGSGNGSCGCGVEVPPINQSDVDVVKEGGVVGDYELQFNETDWSQTRECKGALYGLVGGVRSRVAGVDAVLEEIGELTLLRLPPLDDVALIGETHTIVTSTIEPVYDVADTSNTN